MSLEDLAIRAALKPVAAELDRQKEKCAAMKVERDDARSEADALRVERNATARDVAELSAELAKFRGCHAVDAANIARLRADIDALQARTDVLGQMRARAMHLKRVRTLVAGLRVARAKGAALAAALERMTDPRNWGPAGGWDGPSYPDEIARVALAAWRTP